MKTEFPPQELSSRMLASIIGVLGLMMMAAAVTFWLQFDVRSAAAVALIYGCFLLFMAFYIWRDRCRFTETTPRMGYWLISSIFAFSALISILTAPSIANLPLYHPKTLSCLVMVVAGGLFAVKACRKKTAA